MADKKISQLTAASTPLVGTEVLPIVQSSATVKVAVSDLTAGRTVSMTSATLTSAINIQTSATNRWIIQKDGAGQDLFVYRYNDAGSYAGNPVRVNRANGVITWENGLAQGTAATGINFTANTPAAGMTSQLLNWYEEGTWTPTYTPASGSFTSISYGFNTGQYTRIGTLVYVSWRMRTSALNVGAASGAVSISGLPFAVSGTSVEFALGVGVDFGVNNAGSGRANASTSTIDLLQSLNNTNIVVTDLSTGGANNFTSGFVCYRVA